MKKRSLELRDEAWLEWQGAAWHYDLERHGLGVRFDKAVEAALEHLSIVAAHYQVRENGFRYAPVIKFPYLIVFEIDDDMIVVYNIYHSSRKIIEW
ncbi:MAG: type II toxin-antitoxin system RelE/ParE family toxin [Flavobacteriales bacterium]